MSVKKVDRYEGVIAIHDIDWRYDNVVFLSRVRGAIATEFEKYKGKNISVRFWITSEPVSWEQLDELFVLSLYGRTKAGCEWIDCQYSEWTDASFFYQEMVVGGHNLLSELMSHEGEYAYIEVHYYQ